MENKIRRVDRKLEFQGAILDFYTDYMQMPDGKVVKWDFISHRKGAAAVVPVMDDGKIPQRPLGIFDFFKTDRGVR